MEVRPAELVELNYCYQMNASYTTDYVWQMQLRDNGRRTDIRFDTVRLPRPMQVAYPRHLDELLDHWKQEGCFLVIRNAEDEIIGFVDALPQRWQNLLWIFNLVIDVDYRRQGCGSLLLEHAKRWASQRNLNKMMIEAQSKNHPVITFARKHGFTFCGYNERYYAGGDIALFFSKSI